MVKLLPLGLVVAIMLGVLFYIRFNRSQPSDPKTPSQSVGVSTGLSTLLPSKGSADDTSRRLRDLEETVTLLTKKVTSTAAPSGDSATYTTTYNDSKIKSLEDSVANLQKEVETLKGSQSTTTTTSSKAVVYIPLGSAGSSTDQNWSTLEGYQVSLDPADYPGYKSMQLEVNAKLAQSVGTGYVRLYNVTSGSAVSSSDASTTASVYTLATSGSFTISSGRKTYQLQLKTSDGFELYLQSARIKVNF